MAHFDLYESLRLERTMTCGQLAVELDNRLTAFGPAGGPRVPEMQTARAVLGHPGRRALYDGQLADPRSPDITPDHLMELAVLDIPVASRPAGPSFTDRARATAQHAGRSARRWSEHVTGDNPARAAAATARFGRADPATGRISPDRRVGAFAVDAVLATLFGLAYTAVGLTWFLSGAVDHVRHAGDGDLTALFSLATDFSGGGAVKISIATLVFNVLHYAFRVLCDMYLGGTPGKLLLGGRVITAEGGRPDTVAALKRNCWTVVGSLPVPVLGSLTAPVLMIAHAVSFGTSPRCLSFLDMWAGTAVVFTPTTNTSPSTTDGMCH
jgi:uncharacterized RDD family membrane protein YckC